MLKRFTVIGACLSAAGALGVGGAFAQTKTTTFDVRMTIEAECLLSSATDLDFGKAGVINRNFDAESEIEVICTPGTSYEIALDDRGVGFYEMQDPNGATIEYYLYQDAARSIKWGRTPGVDTLSYTSAEGSFEYAHVHIVYGRVEPHIDLGGAPPGVYTDTVTVSLIY